MKVKFLPLIGAVCLTLMFIGKAIPTKAHEECKEPVSAVNTFREGTNEPIYYEIIYLDHDVSENEPKISEEDRDLMARVVMSEASILPIEGKQAVAQTILNRLADGRWGDTIEEVVNYPLAYSTADNGEPTAECYYAVDGAIEYPEAFPTNMFYFRSGHYHSFANDSLHRLQDYTQIGNTYFSTEVKECTN